MQSNQVSYTKTWGSVILQVKTPDIPNSKTKDDKEKIQFNKKNKNESLSMSTDIFNRN